MTWNALHHRGEVLRTVIDEANVRQDGVLPLHVTGVSETFHDDVDLLATLHLRWSTRLAGNAERALADQPQNPPQAVVDAYVSTAEAMPGVWAILEGYTAEPANEDMRRMLERATAKSRRRLAVMAGLRGVEDHRGEQVGARLETEARLALATEAASETSSAGAADQAPVPTQGTESGEAGASRPDEAQTRERQRRFVRRLKAALAA